MVRHMPYQNGYNIRGRGPILRHTHILSRYPHRMGPPFELAFSCLRKVNELTLVYGNVVQPIVISCQ